MLKARFCLDTNECVELLEFLEDIPNEIRKESRLTHLSELCGIKNFIGGATMQHKIYLSNAFSLNMLDVSTPVKLFVRPIDLDTVKSLLKSGFESTVGHQSTAEILTSLLGIEVPANRVAIKLQPGDTLIVFQLNIRLQEGQVLSSEEVFDLYNKGQASFIIVEVGL